MHVQNLWDSDVKALESKIAELKQENPDISYQIFQMQKGIEKEEIKPVQQQVDELAEMVIEIQRTIKHIFGNHVLINGQFQDLKIGIKAK
jgi:flagellar biosynthesis chaperone FliJ